MLFILQLALFSIAVLWDLLSLILNVRRAFKGNGASGTPIISWLVYLLLTEWGKQNFFFTSPAQAGVTLTVFHVLCHFAIPWPLEFFQRKKHIKAKDGLKRVD